jgi:hypothetical protein
MNWIDNVFAAGSTSLAVSIASFSLKLYYLQIDVNPVTQLIKNHQIKLIHNEIADKQFRVTADTSTSH